MGDPGFEPGTSSLSETPKPETGVHQRVAEDTYSQEMSLFDDFPGGGLKL
jgi:hypothetical protein